jgi:hypothetical protein
VSSFQNGNTSDDLEALAEEWYEEREPLALVVASPEPVSVLVDKDGSEIVVVRRPIGFVPPRGERGHGAPGLLTILAALLALLWVPAGVATGISALLSGAGYVPWWVTAIGLGTTAVSLVAWLAMGGAG